MTKERVIDSLLIGKYRRLIAIELYRPNDNFDLLSRPRFGSLLAKIDAAVREGRDTVEIWGSGEFPHVDDVADAVVFLMNLVGRGADQHRDWN